MTGKKHEIDGESFIISDGIDMDDLDLENMVSRDTIPIPDILKTQYARPPAIENIPGMVPNHKPLELKQQERIWLEVLVEVEKTEEAFPGFVEKHQVVEDGSYWQVRMNRAQALKLMALMTKGSLNSILKPKCKKITLVHDKDEEVIEVQPKTYFDSFSVEDHSDEDCFIKVAFELRTN